MTSMTYCMFENTAEELDNCIEGLTEVGHFDELDLSDSETIALRRLSRMCKEFLELYKDLEQRSMEDPEYI